MAEKKANESNGRTNGVMITVYVESPATPSRKLSGPVEKKKPQSQFKRLRANSESKGYDRRAQLLAYARDLRNTKPQPQADEVQLPRHKSKKSSEKCLFFELCSPTSRKLRQSNNRWRYDLMPFNQCKEFKPSRKKKSKGKTGSSFLRKLKSMLKELSCKKIKL